MEHYDLIVLGSGSAARDGAAKAASKYGAKVALVETTRWGGSCPNVACKPTKAYLVVAELVHDINELAGTLGVEVGPATVDLARVKARKDSLKKAQPKWVADLSSAGFETYEEAGATKDFEHAPVGNDGKLDHLRHERRREVVDDEVPEIFERVRHFRAARAGQARDDREIGRLRLELLFLFRQRARHGSVLPSRLKPTQDRHDPARDVRRDDGRERRLQ